MHKISGLTLRSSRQHSTEKQEHIGSKVCRALTITYQYDGAPPWPQTQLRLWSYEEPELRDRLWE